MKIRHRLNLVIIVTLIAFTSIVWIYLDSGQRVQRERAHEELLRATVSAVGDLETLAYDFFLGGTERAYLQWRSRHEVAAELTRELWNQRLVTSDNGDKIAAILDDADEHIVAIWLDRARTTRTSTRRVQNHILVQLHEAGSRAGRLLVEISDQHVVDQVHHNKIILVLMLLAASITVFMLSWLHLSVNRPLARLRGGVHQLATGSLDIQVATDAADEIGELSREFQSMSGKLSTVMASRNELNREMEHRATIERSLRESEGRYRTLVENAPEAVVVLDTESGHFIDVNRNAEIIYGMSKEKLLKIGPAELSPAAQADGTPSAPLARHFIGQALAGGTPVFEWTHKGPDGALFPAEIRLVRLPADAQNLVRGSIIDITERKRQEDTLKQSERHQRALVNELRSTQAQLIQAEKFAAMGNLISGVAHEINNPLMGILNYVQYVKARVEDERLLKYLSLAEKEAKRAGRVTANMLSYARGPKTKDGEHVAVDMAQVITSALEIIAPRIKEMHAQLESDLLAEHSLCVQGNPDELMQVLINLFNNALDAMKEVRRRRLSCRLLERDERVELEVRDSGPGVPQEIRTRIFDPFFTTKPEGQGTGLGLALSRQLVEAMGGQLQLAESRTGTRFVLRLPLVSVDTRGEGADAPRQAAIDPMEGVGT